ncbi:MAG: iron chaperone [Saprospiraceae bacterium]
MLYDVKTPTEYLDQLEKDWRYEKVQQLRKIIQIKAPHLVEGIDYKMLCYGDEEGVLFHLNAQMNYVSFYVGDIKKVDHEGKMLEGINLGKGCVRFKKSINIEETRIDEFIEKILEMRKKGKDFGC